VGNMARYRVVYSKTIDLVAVDWLEAESEEAAKAEADRRQQDGDVEVLYEQDTDGGMEFVVSVTAV
jgi:hypothetical protein